MRGRTAAFIAASAVSVGALAGTASAAGGPPPPKAVSGHTVQLVASGLNTPTSFAFGGGAVFEGDGGSNQQGVPVGGVFLLKNGTGTKLAGSPAFVAGLAWHDKTLYVSGGVLTGKTSATWKLLAWSGWNGKKFTKSKTIYTAPKKFQGFNGLAFGPNGRLYVGVDVGLLDDNDHGPSTLSPYLYDILSINPNGTGLKVFARGIRQPWQFAFAPGSSTPFVSDLGQDSGVKNPPIPPEGSERRQLRLPPVQPHQGEQVRALHQAVQGVRAAHGHHGPGHHRQDPVPDLVLGPGR